MGRIVKLCREKAIDAERVAEIAYAELVRQKIALETSGEYLGLRDPWVAGEFYSPVDWSSGSPLKNLIELRFPHWNSLGECGIALPREVAEELELVSKLKIFPTINVFWAPNGEAFVVYGKLHDNIAKRFPIAYWGDEDYIAKVSAEAEAMKMGAPSSKSSGLNWKRGLLAGAIVAAVMVAGALWKLSGESEKSRSNLASIDPQIARQAEVAKFSWLDPNITVRNFPDVGLNTEHAKVYSFPSPVSFNEVVEKMERDGYQPANLMELLVYSQGLPDSKDFICALGQSWRDEWGYLRFPTAWYGEKRSVYLTWHNDWWPKDSKFLAVPISPSKN